MYYNNFLWSYRVYSSLGAPIIDKLSNISDIVDLDFMQNVQDFFANTMDVALQSFVDEECITQPSNFIEYCSKYIMENPRGIAHCQDCLKHCSEKVKTRKKHFIFKCPAGLTNFAIPIIIDGKHYASILGGKVLTEPVDEKQFRNLAKKLNINENELVAAAKNVRIVPMEKFEVIAEAIDTITNSIVAIAVANYKLSRLGMDYKIPRNIAIEEWLFLNCDKDKRPISAREFEVLKLIVQGKSNTEIAKELFISVHTAKAHVSSILEKFLAEDRVQVAVKAVREGLI